MIARRILRRSTIRPLRRGLAPLELVLSLPILLFVMALMIDFGTAACWKVRAAVVARNAVWSARWPRSGASPQPANWPTSASQGVQTGSALNVLNDPDIDQPVVRGPTLGQTQVNRNLLDPTQGLLVGSSGIQQAMPLLSAMTRPIKFNLTHPLLDNGFQYQRLGLTSNQQRREPILYQFAQPDASLMQAYVNAVTAIWYSPLQGALAVLDKDQEIFNWYGFYEDFHPVMSGFCSLNVQSVRQNNVLPLIDRIQGRKNPRIAGVPERMARFFVNMYRAEINSLQAQMQQPGANIGNLQGQVQGLQSTIQTLQQFIATL